MYDKLIYNNYYTVDYLDEYFNIHIGEQRDYYSFTHMENKQASESDVTRYDTDDVSSVIKVIERPNVTNGALDVSVQDQYTEVINLYLCNVKGTTTLTTNYVIDTKVVVVTSATGAVVGDCINISENGRVFQSIVTNVTGTTITFVSGTDQAFTTNAVVCFAEWDLAQANGSVTPLIYKICPPAGAIWDITKLNFSITDGTAMDDSKFGGITQLTKGIVFRVVDGYTKQLGIISNNAGFREYGFTCEYNDRAGVSGTYGYNGSNFIGENGTILRLHGDTQDEFQVIVNDNLTGLTKLAFVAQGHVVE